MNILDMENKRAIAQTISTRIREARKATGMNQTDFGVALGYENRPTAQAVVARMESGKMLEYELYTILCISKVTGKSLYYFLGSDY